METKPKFMTVTSRIGKRLGTLAAIALLVGCGQNIASVTGSVTYNGQPVKKGFISFQPSNGQGKSFAAPIADGVYTAPQAVPGNMTAIITGTREVNFYASSAESYQKANEAQKSGKLADVAEAADYIAPDAEGNSKEVEVQPGDQTLDFAITGAPIPK
jgi:hypothetical protein